MATHAQRLQVGEAVRPAESERRDVVDLVAGRQQAVARGAAVLLTICDDLLLALREHARRYAANVDIGGSRRRVGRLGR